MALRKFYWKLSEYLATRPSECFSIIADRNGQLFEVRDEAIGKMISKVSNVKELEEVPSGFQFALPKISGSILQQIISFFRYYCNEWLMNEVMVQIYWDTMDKKYVIECPRQFVRYDKIHAVFDQVPERFIQVCHFHSHNSMPAVFSSTDDENETAFMIYGVVGYLHRQVPEILLRVGYNGNFFIIPLERIFVDPRLSSPLIVMFPTEWHSRITIID